MATVLTLEQCRISPSSENPASDCEFSLQVVIFDMIWYDHSNKAVSMYEFPCSKSHFLESIIPDLKKSLSLTLAHFLAVAGNVIHPLSQEQNPIIRYSPGDAVSFNVCESNVDLNRLTGYHPRSSEQFYSLAPNMPLPSESLNGHYIACPVFAAQVTLFPGQGISVGLNVHHALFDASTSAAIQLAWAFINKTKLPLTEKLLPFYDRKTLVNLDGLDSFYWNHILKMNTTPADVPPKETPEGKIRSTFFLKKHEIQKLKNYILMRKKLDYLSSFTVTCAFSWVCAAKSFGPRDDEDLELFGFSADCRGRLEPPMPANYFGSCAAPMFTELNHDILKGPDGLVMAAEAIHELIRERVRGPKGILHWAKDWPEYRSRKQKSQYWVGGSSKFDFYGIDYGWGRPANVECLFTDKEGAIFICSSRDFEGALEISLSNTEAKMKSFATHFEQHLHGDSLVSIH